MRVPFERLVEQVAALSDGDQELPMGILAERLGVSTERLRDAIDALKMLAGQPTMVPSDEDRIRDIITERARQESTGLVVITCTRHGVGNCWCLAAPTMASATRPPGGYPAGTVSR